MSKIYTKTGDRGTSSLVGGTRVRKDDKRLHAYGEVDELNSFVGLLKSFSSGIIEEADNNLLTETQSSLFIIGSHLACEPEKVEIFKLPNFDKSLITRLEKRMDELDSKLPELKNFILPGGSNSSSTAHLCRTVCRRVERSMIALSQEIELKPEFVIYINRLSDYFFILARFFNKLESKQDIVWSMR